MIVRALMFLLLSSLAGTGQCGFIVIVNEVGNDVVVTGSGTINTGSLTPTVIIADTTSPYFFPNEMEIAFTPLLNPDGFIGTFVGPTSIGGGLGGFANLNSSPRFAFFPSLGGLVLPPGYTSGNTISASMTISNESFTSMGLTPGTYTWTFGAGANADFITIQVSAVPEPSVWMLLVFTPLVKRLTDRKCRDRKFSVT